MQNVNYNMEDVTNYAIKCFQDEAQAILDLIPKLDDNFSKAVDMVYHCTGKVIVTGVGKSGHVGEKIAATLASLGTPSFFLNPLDAYHGDLGMIAKGDIVMAISYSGNTDELLRFIPYLIDRKISIIGISGNPKSLLAQYSECHLNIAVDHEADPLNLAPTSSTTTTMVMGDALACALVHLRHFKQRDFARFHPGGTLGRRLLTTAEDVMIRENLPVIPAEMSLGQAIIHVSKGKLGMGVSVDEEGVIEGLITDGDIRRAMERWQEQFFNHTVSDIMTRTPKIVTPKTRIAEIQRIMQQHKIHSVLVADQRHRLLGIVDNYACEV